MNARIGILLGLPVLAFLGWLLWTEVFQGNAFLAWQEELLPSAQQLSPDLVSEFRAGSLANYPGFAYRLTPQDEAQFLREKAFWEEVRVTRSGYDTARWNAADKRALTLLERLETSQLALPWVEVARTALHPVSGWHLRSLYLLAYTHHIGSTEDCDGYIYRLREYPDRLAEAVSAQEAAAKAGRCPDSSLLNQTILQLRTWAAMSVREQILYRSLATRMTRLDPTAINEYQSLEYLRQTAELIEQTLAPAWRAAADRLEAIACPVSSPFPLSSADFLNWSASRAGLPAPEPGLLARLQAMADSPGAPAYAPTPAASTDLRLPLLEIAQATEGILPGQLKEKVRLQQPGVAWTGNSPRVISGTRDSALFPIVILPDSGHREELLLDLYQFGMPGAAWMQQRLVESEQPQWRLLAHNSDQQAGWGLAALELMHTRILWFSRDSALQQAYFHRMARVTAMALLDARLHNEGAGYEQALATLHGAGWSESDLMKMQSEVQNAPGQALSRWLVWQWWHDQLNACEGDVRTCIEALLAEGGEVGR